MNSNVLAGITLVAVLGFGAYSVTHTPGVGPQGPQGERGANGQSLVGPQGPRGERGVNGSNGITPRFGGSGPVGNELVQFLAGFVVSDDFATTTPGSATLTARETAGFSTVSFFPSVGDVTLTLPASTTLGSFLGPIAGSMKRVCYYNATTTAGIDITWASGTGVDLEIASSTVASEAVSLVQNADSSVCIEYQRKSGTAGANRNDIVARFLRYADGD